MGQLTAQYNVDPSTGVSEHTYQRPLLDMGLLRKRPTSVPMLAERYGQLHLLSRNIKSVSYSCHWELSLRRTIVSPCSSGHAQVCGASITLRRTI
ncbi:hypothetical protein TNCV_2201621 [Trichonephila clavipes]|nr:hypothetical protein TNCV_2201621 [Trichonephila clavipes]